MEKNTKDLSNKVNHEKLNTGNNEEIKKRILKLDFDDLEINKAESRFILNTITGINGVMLEGRHKFIYTEKLDIDVRRYNIDDNNGKTNNLKVYFQNLRNEMKRVLNINRIIKEFDKKIGWIDGVARNEHDKLKNLPRYEKLIRLKRSYELLVSMSLSIIHNYYWVDITKKDDGQSTKYNLEDCIRLASPLIIYLKDHFEREVHEELDFDDDELELLKKYKL